MILTMILKNTRGYTKADILRTMEYEDIQYCYAAAQPSRYDLGVRGLQYFDDLDLEYTQKDT